MVGRFLTDFIASAMEEQHAVLFCNNFDKFAGQSQKF